MKLVNTIFQRIEELKLKPREVFLAAGVDPALIHYWKKAQPKSWEKWDNLLNDNYVHAPGPDESTYSIFGDKAQDVFLAAGYARSEIHALWRHRDAKAVEHYKRITHYLESL